MAKHRITAKQLSAGEAWEQLLQWAASLPYAAGRYSQQNAVAARRTLVKTEGSTMEPDRIDLHNSSQIDKAAEEFVQFARRAITEKPHGSLTLRMEWRGFLAHRLVINQEHSTLLAVEPE